jgi:hypothetical protein
VVMAVVADAELGGGELFTQPRFDLLGNHGRVSLSASGMKRLR